MSSSAKILVPTVGESITQGVISNWLKQDGEFVKSGESLFELETDKITAEVPAPDSGIVRIKVPAGTTVDIGAEVGIIEIGSGNGKPASQRQPTPPPPPVTVSPPPKPIEPVIPPPTSKPLPVSATQVPHDIALPPSLRRMIVEKGLDAAKIAAAAVSPSATAPAKSEKPTGTKGAPPPQPLVFQPGQRELRKRMTPLRARIAERLVASKKETATLTTFNEVDMNAVIELRDRYKDAFKEKYGVSLGFMSFFVKATIAALKIVPAVNARLENGEIVYQNFYDIGIAVSTEKGLVVPILRSAEKMSFAEIENNIAALALKARENKLTIEELQGGTFTISNGGIYGSLMSTPILNPPQSGILGMHAIKKRPVVLNEQIIIRPMMYLALSYDHRLIDGKESVTFLLNVKEYIETPGKFLLDLI